MALGFMGFEIFSTRSWLSSLSSSSTTDLHLKLLSPLIGPIQTTLTTFSIFLCASCVLGLIAAATAKRYATSMWIFLLVLMLLCESILTILFLINQKQVLFHLLVFLLHKLHTEYGSFEKSNFTHQVNFMQQKFECCGFVQPSDYRYTQWISDQQPNINVPLSCCQLINERSMTRWKNPHPIDLYDCQRESGETRFKQGCFQSVLMMISMYSKTSLIRLLFIVILQAAGILVAFSLCRKIDKIEFASYNS